MAEATTSVTMHNIITVDEVQTIYDINSVPPSIADALRNRLARVSGERASATLTAGVFLGAAIVGRRYTPPVPTYELQSMVMSRINIALGRETPSI